MTLGTGIFLSALFLGIVILFVSSKDKNKWKRVFKFGLLLLGVGVLAIGGYVGYQEWDSSRPKKASSLWGINLSDTKDDVIFKKGKAPFTMDDTGYWVYPAKPGETVLNNTYVIGWKNGKLHFISSEPESGFDEIQGIYYGQSTSADIEKKFGKPAEIKPSDDKTSRLYLYPQYQLFFTLTADRVDRFGVYDPNLGQPGKK